MDPNLSDKEQVDLLKKWFKEYGIGLLVAIILGAGLGYGWRAYQAHQNKVAVAAADQYAVMALLVESGQKDLVKKRASEMISQHPGSVYAVMAQFMRAKIAVESKQFSAAVKPLEACVVSAPTAGFKQLARLRLARVYLQLKDYDSALNTLKKQDDAAFVAAIQQLQGDIYFAKGDVTAAMQLYKKAKQSYAKLDISNPVLEMKLAS